MYLKHYTLQFFLLSRSSAFGQIQVNIVFNSLCSAPALSRSDISISIQSVSVSLSRTYRSEPTIHPSSSSSKVSFVFEVPIQSLFYAALPFGHMWSFCLNTHVQNVFLHLFYHQPSPDLYSYCLFIFQRLAHNYSKPSIKLISCLSLEPNAGRAVAADICFTLPPQILCICAPPPANLGRRAVEGSSPGKFVPYLFRILLFVGLIAIFTQITKLQFFWVTASCKLQPNGVRWTLTYSLSTVHYVTWKHRTSECFPV